MGADNIANLDLKSFDVEVFLMEMEFLNRVSKSFVEHKDQTSFYSLATTTVGPLSDNEDAVQIYSLFLDNLVNKFQEAYPNSNEQLVFAVAPNMDANEELATKLETFNLDTRNLKQMNTMQLDEVCGTDGVVCLDHKLGAASTSYQIAIWFTLCAFLATCAFSCNFCMLDFSQDATLYTTWV